MPNEPKKLNNKDKHSEYYELRERDIEKLRAIKDAWVEACEAANIPSVCLAQIRHTEDGFGILGANMCEGKRASFEIFVLCTIVQWLQSDDPADKKRYADVMRLVMSKVKAQQLGIDDDEANPMMMLASLLGGMAGMHSHKKPTDDDDEGGLSN
jgi:hypothetical protein